MPEERRRYRRHECELRALLRERVRTAALKTVNISRHGVFIITDSPKPERELVRLSFELPDGPLEVMGMVARAVPRDAAAGAHPGMGIDFFALAKQAKDRWDAFVEGAPDAPSAALPDPVRRKHPRQVTCFLIRLRDRHRLREYYTRDISGGGTLLKTPSPGEVAPEVDMILVHPETDDEFSLTGRVVRVINSPSIQERGVAIQFSELAASRERALLAFIETGVNYLERSSEERQEKIALLREAVELAPDSPLPLAALGQALLEEGDHEAAVAAFERSLAVDPECMAAHRGLFDAHSATGAHSRAHKHLVAIRRHEKRSGSFDAIPRAAPK